MMTTLSLVVDRDDEVNELDYLLEHYQDRNRRVGRPDL